MNNQIANLAQIIKELQSHTSNPSVTILMPTARTIPDKLQDRIQLKDLVTQVRDELLKQFQQRDIEPLLERINKMIDEFDFEIESSGLALFANASFETIIRLPFAVKTYTATDQKFHISPLLRELYKNNHYWVLELTKKMSRLYEALNSSLTEKITPEFDAQGNPVQGFPLDYREPTDKSTAAIGRGDRDARALDDQEKHYFAMVDNELGKVLHEKPLPVIVCAAEKNGALFRGLTKHAAAIIGYQHGDFKNVHEIAQAIAPVLEEHRQQETKKLLERFVEEAGYNKQAFGLQRVWLMAQEGRIDYLLVEEGLVISGIVDPNDSNHILISDKKAVTNGTHDLIDRLINRVIETRGRIVFVPQGALKDFEHVGAILRF